MSDRPVISVILPTIRPHLIEACINRWVPALRTVSTELIVVADFPAPFPFNRGLWLVQERQGATAATALGYHASRGDYVFAINDETTPDPDILIRLLEAAEAQLELRLLTPRHEPAYPFFYYGLPFAPFPFGKWILFKKLGGFFDTAYKAFYADPDLSLRAHANSVPVEVVPRAVIHHANDITRPDHIEAVSSYLAADRELFRSRWDHLGEFRDP